MKCLLTNLLNDDHGFVVSAELILIATIAVLGLVAGLSEISFAVNNELEDVGSAFGSLNQSFHVNGAASNGKGSTAGSRFDDAADVCDAECDIHASGMWSED